ncbi:MAG: N-acetylglucosamine-6-phosphate deacetylase [Lachnospiraceae bacterium]
MKSLINGMIYLDSCFQKNKVLLFDDRIQEILDLEFYRSSKANYNITEEIDAGGNFIIPGLIDTHIHGYGGFDTMDGSTKSIEAIAAQLPANGVTAFLPTTMTMSMKRIEASLLAIRTVMNSADTSGSMILGAHMEGPFINEAQKGAQSAEYIRLPDRNMIEKFKDILRVVTIAPEEEGALNLIKDYCDQINFSVGHTNATFEQANAAFAAGAKGVTHLFNAMSGLKHRAPGVVGAALLSDTYAEIIADNFHLHKAIYPLVVKTKGYRRILLITDCMNAGGMPEGTYDLGGQEVKVTCGQCRLHNGTLAGSILKLNQGLYHFAKTLEEDHFSPTTSKDLLSEEPVSEVILARTIPFVTENQAQFLGVNDQMGTLDTGKLANIVVMDTLCKIKKTFIKGKKVYEDQIS